MPAITVENVLTLPRIPNVSPVGALERPLLAITTAPQGVEGEGFPVRRAFYGLDQRDLDPFIHMDQMGEVEYGPGEPKGTAWHPHRGFETVTIAYQGEVDHEDTGGNRGSIRPGDVQWMTAGSGVLHKEMHGRDYARRGGPFEMLQLWVNLPAKSKMTSPRYQELLDRDIPAARLPGDAGSVRVIAGEFEGAKGPARTFTPINLFDLRLRAGHRVRLDLREGWTAALFVLRGKVSVNGEAANEGELVVFEREGGEAAIEAASDATVFVMNGKPIDEPIAGYGPFVMNTQEQIRQAVVDYQSGRLGRIPSSTH